MKKTFRIFTGLTGWIFTIVCSGIIIGSFAALLIFNHYTQDLPDYSTLEDYNPPTLSRIYAKDGRLISEYGKQKRVYAPLPAIPSQVIGAFLSAEDKNFYSHTGIDYTGIARAVWTNIINHGDGGLVGGSTITQQVVKNFLLTNEQSIRRKVREAVLAIRITNVYSKDRILELYLNEIFLGNRSYGVAAAAMNYFNRALNELTIEEAALLAALPKAPSHLDPTKNYQDALERRNWVLGRMYDDNRITRDELNKALQTKINLRNRDAQETVDADYFAAEVKRFLKEELGEKIVSEGGLSVITTLDPAMQQKADAALREQLIAYDRRRGYRGGQGKIEDISRFAKILPHHEAQKMLIADQQLATVLKLTDDAAQIGLSDGQIGTIPMKLLSWTRRVMGDDLLGPEVSKPSDILAIGDIIIVGKINDEQAEKLSKEQQKTAWDLQQVPLVNGAMVVAEPNSGKVLALSGGYSYQVSSFNRATQAKRQPGSAFKPFVYLSALENGMTPATRVLDDRIELNQGSGEIWRPENYADTYLGPTTLRRGLEKSRNTMTVRIGQALGMRRIIEVAERFGIYQDVKSSNLSMVLGTLETSVVNLLNGYAAIANGGRRVTPILVERVEDRQGNVIYQRDLRGCPTCNIGSDETNLAALTPPSLFDPRERIVDARVAYQTVSMLQGVVQRGTAASAASLPWALGGKTGTTNESRDTWFMGISPNLVAGVFIGYDNPAPLGAKYTGSSLALPVFKTFIESALKGTPKKEFAVPSGLKRVKIDSITGLALEPWEADGRPTTWELFLHSQVPLFKTDSLLALGDIPHHSRDKLGMEDYLFEAQPAPLPWQMQQQNGAAPLGNFSDYNATRNLPPETYIPPNNSIHSSGQMGTDPEAAYVPQIKAPSRAPVQAAPQPQPGNLPTNNSPPLY